MDKKYQIFVSSTYEDLQEERQEVMHALLELNCIPAGMELFPAANEDQWSLIRGVIDDCDYYLVISAGRYGSIGPDGLSYTEMEYRYAVEQNKPVIAFLHKDLDSLPKRRTEATEDGHATLAAFRELMQQRMCKFWHTPQELGSVVSRSLIMLQRKHPGIGWVRGDLVPDKDASLELLDLRKQIERLEAQLDAARTQAPPGTERFAQGVDEFAIEYSANSTKERFSNYSWTGTICVEWDQIFYTVSPLLIHEATESDVRHALNALVRDIATPVVQDNQEAEGHRFSHFQVSHDSFHTIIVQLRALGLITQSMRNRSVKDTATYWTLTPFGDSVMIRLRAIERATEAPKEPKQQPPASKMSAKGEATQRSES